MLNRIVLPMLALGFSATVHAMGVEDDPLLAMVKLDKLEVHENSDGPNPWSWKADAWVGRDLHKLWLKTEGEYHDGETEEMELQLLYSRAITPFWDLQLGARRDFKPEPERDWLAIGVNGLAPYLFEVDAALFFGEDSRAAARLDAEYEYLFSQRLVLIPELEANLYSKADEELGIGKGLADLTLGLRLAYEVRREFAPYIGYSWTGLYGDTADYAEAVGSDTSEGAWVAGIKAWF
ncbi:MAG: copper resistance protein B [Pseudomonadota bacterium]